MGISPKAHKKAELNMLHRDKKKKSTKQKEICNLNNVHMVACRIPFNTIIDIAIITIDTKNSHDYRNM